MVLATVGVVGMTFVFWLVVGLVWDLGGNGDQGFPVMVRRTIKALLDFPRFPAFWAFPKEWPLLAPSALLGFLWLFDQAARREADPIGNIPANCSYRTGRRLTASSKCPTIFIGTPRP